MKHRLFTGACTALVTPFRNGKVNIDMLKILLDRQIESGINAIVICGTTGEASTLSDAEKISLFREAKKHVGAEYTIIAGTGSNDTAHAVSLSMAAEDAGADGVLVVSPYYNKATPEGIYIHYTTIASSIHIPLIIYNVPSRTGMDIPVSVYKELAQVPNIAGVKEASSDIVKFAQILRHCPSDFTAWSGNDNQIVPTMSLGGAGVISVVSNVAPAETQAMALAALDGDFDTAAHLQLGLLPLMEKLFCEVNPIPVKAAMKLLGYDCGPCRLPLTPIHANHLRELSLLLKHTE